VYDHLLCPRKGVEDPELNIISSLKIMDMQFNLDRAHKIKRQ
jgi:hypothetical protein